VKKAGKVKKKSAATAPTWKNPNAITLVQLIPSCLRKSSFSLICVLAMNGMHSALKLAFFLPAQRKNSVRRTIDRSLLDPGDCTEQKEGVRAFSIKPIQKIYWHSFPRSATITQLSQTPHGLVGYLPRILLSCASEQLGGSFTVRVNGENVAHARLNRNDGTRKTYEKD
jgi:hypothetical protein